MFVVKDGFVEPKEHPDGPYVLYSEVIGEIPKKRGEPCDPCGVCGKPMWWYIPHECYGNAYSSSTTIRGGK